MPTDELLIRQMPHSPEAEQAVLGSMLAVSTACACGLWWIPRTVIFAACAPWPFHWA